MLDINNGSIKGHKDSISLKFQNGCFHYGISHITDINLVPVFIKQELSKSNVSLHEIPYRFNHPFTLLVYHSIFIAYLDLAKLSII